MGDRKDILEDRPSKPPCMVRGARLQQGHSDEDLGCLIVLIILGALLYAGVRDLIKYITADPVEVALEIVSERSVAAVEDIVHQSKLARVAMEAKNPEARKAAIERLIDQNMLVEVIKGIDDFHVREAAVMKLTDPVLLASIASDHKELIFIRRAAIHNENLTDSDLVGRIALGDTSEHIRETAVMKLTDLALLAKIAVKDGNEYIRNVAKNRKNELSR